MKILSVSMKLMSRSLHTFARFLFDGKIVLFRLCHPWVFLRYAAFILMWARCWPPLSQYLFGCGGWSVDLRFLMASCHCGGVGLRAALNGVERWTCLHIYSALTRISRVCRIVSYCLHVFVTGED